MPDFLKKLILLIAASAIGWKAITLNLHNLKGLLITLAIMLIAEAAILKWKFE